MDNQQLSLLTREQLQVFLTARLGDGCITSGKLLFLQKMESRDYPEME